MSKQNRNSRRSATPATVVPEVVVPVVEAAPAVVVPEVVAPAAPVVTTMDPGVASGNVPQVPLVQPKPLWYVAGKAYSPRNTDGAAHQRQGDVKIFAGFVAAMAADPEKRLLPEAALAAIMAVNPKNKSFLNYCCKNGWLRKVYAAPVVETAPVAAPSDETPEAE